MAEPVNPSRTLTSFSCPHCSAHAQQHWYAIYGRSLDDDLPRVVDADLLEDIKSRGGLSDQARKELLALAYRLRTGEVFFGEGEDIYRPLRLENVHVSVCYSCKALTLWVNDQIVHPPTAAAGIDPNPDLSAPIRADFKEAGQILTASPRGAAALLRLCIQKLCIELGEPGDNLNDDIASLVKRGLNVHIQQALDIVRVVGNNAVHPGQIDLNDDRDTAVRLFELVNIIADELITRPAKVNKLYTTVVPESIRVSIAKRDKS